MAQPNETNQTNAPIPFRSHTALLLSVALPFLQPAYRHPVELALKFLEFSETIKLFQEFHLSGSNPFSSFRDAASSPQENGIFGLIHTFILDPEGLLHGLSNVCTGDEREIINLFLNIIRMKNFYETYGDLLQMPGLFSGGMSGGEKASPDIPFSPNDLTSMLSDDQKETLDLLKSLFSNE